jgi:hypothetical protein
VKAPKPQVGDGDTTAERLVGREFEEQVSKRIAEGWRDEAGELLGCRHRRIGCAERRKGEACQASVGALHESLCERCREQDARDDPARLQRIEHARGR